MPCPDPGPPRKPLAWAAGALLAVPACMAGLVALALWRGHEPMGGPSEGAAPPSLPAPMLETAPQPNQQAYLAAKRQRLEPAGAMAEGQDTARIPLQAAMRLMVDREGHQAIDAHAADRPGNRPAAQPPSQTGAPPSVSLHPRVGQRLPSALPFIDASTGQPVTLGDFFGHRRPLVLVLGYARCRTLCGTLLQGVMQALLLTGRDSDSYRLVHVSIDPAETAAQAAAHQAAIARALGWPAQGGTLHSLVGSEAAIRALTQAVGFDREATDEHGRPLSAAAAAAAADGTEHLVQYAHPIGFVVLTADGRIARHVAALQPDPRQLAQALDDAGSRPSADGAPPVLPHLAPLGATLLRCLHVDAATGPMARAAILGTRFMGVALAIALAAWIWRHRHGPTREAGS